MQNRKGSTVIIAGLVIAVIIIGLVLVYKFVPGNYNYQGNDLIPASQITAEPELTNTDEISDIEADLNSTSTENLDADLLGITSEVE